MAKQKWKLVTSFPIQSYKCGLVAGQKIRLKSGYEVFCTDGSASGRKHETGEIWTVLSGADEDKVVVRLRDANGDLCTWDDDAKIFEDFELIEGES